MYICTTRIFKIRKYMRFLKEDSGFLFEFDGLWDYVKFCFGKILGGILFFVLLFLGLLLLGAIV